MLNTLNVALSGLYSSKTQVENVMNNIANENTVGYKKRVVDVKEAENSDNRLTGRGSTIADVNRITNIYIYDNLIKAQSKNAEYSELSTMLADVESIFYETDTSGMSNSLDGYFQAIEDLRANPYSEIYRTNLANQGNILVDGMKSLYANIEDREAISKSFLYDNVDEINGILHDIGSVNQLIQNEINPSNDLLDKRDYLESRLSEYVKINVDRSESYTLETGGVTAVRYNTNIHEVRVVDESVAQKDVYADDFNVSNLVAGTWSTESSVKETQTVAVTGTASGQVNFLGTNISGSTSLDTATTTASRIVADKTNVIANWNASNPTKEIEDITASGTTLTITYKSTSGDADVMPASLSNGITFAASSESTKGKTGADSLTYYFNKDTSITVVAGESITDNDGQFFVDKTSIVRALTYKINNDPVLKNTLVAYNGQYSTDENGNKIPQAPTAQDHYLILEAKVPGLNGGFDGRIIVNDNDVKDANLNQISNLVEKNTKKSLAAENDIHLEIFDEEIPVESGKIKSILDNIDTTSPSNKFDKYKQMLDNFAKALSDTTEAYIFQGEGQYVTGEEASLLSKDKSLIKRIGLFEGSDIKTLSFNSSVIGNLAQADLDYLSTIHWNENIKIDGTDPTSFSKYYQNIRVTVSADKENVDYLKDTQSAVTESLTLTYDKLVKVDKDNEMVDLIKFQAAYEANAKLVTIVDEMLQTILGMKR